MPYSNSLEIENILTAVDHNLVIAFIDLNGHFEYVNDNFCRKTQFSSEELIDQHFSMLLPDSGFEDQVSEAFKKVRSGDIWQGEVLNRKKDGTLYWVHSTIVPLLDEEGKPARYFTYKNDISDRIKIEKKLKATEKQLELSVNELNYLKHVLNQSSIVTIIDHDRHILYANEQFETLMNCRASDIIGKSLDVLNARCHPDCFYEEMWQTVRSGDIWSGEVQTQTIDGEARWTNTRIFPFIDYGENAHRYIFVSNDITQMKNAEQLALRSEKLSVLGELAAGIAHEIRNPLTSLKGFTALLEERETEKDKKAYISVLKSEIDRIEYTVNELMMLAKPQKVEMKLVKIEELVRSICIFLQPELALKNINLSCDGNSPSAEVLCESNQMKQVVMNVLKNAIEAMRQGGHIHISYRYKEKEMSIVIKDDGDGMPEEILQKIDTPFFTTKQTGNGLGIPMCHNIMKLHHGEMKISSIVGAGTVVELVLPY
ncbi:PAS domain-containing sensor histidine kinase [Jeotgalibacillus salarius]|uniref:histidine kinase n=1 Tax=Jeotgalibacillus salarius TaxID=546023 RepID=A0A4Y8LDG3_9BACL|nr:PAS domain-containing sensor histidine kinase [Jeotgalibacillus salarius]TFE00502.1 PAS domain-containing sensor histidine kinase [Jeotgalibacillus salarius]